VRLDGGVGVGVLLLGRDCVCVLLLFMVVLL